MIRKVHILTILSIFFCNLLYNGCSFTKVEKNDDWSFVVFGDVKDGFSNYNHLVNNMMSTSPLPEFAVCLGDITSYPLDEQKWLRFWDVSEPITNKMNLYIVRGNHEGNDSASEQIFREQTQIERNNFYFSFRIHDTYLILLDTEIRGEAGSIVNEQLRWLKFQIDSVSKVTDIKNIFLFMHRPLYPQGLHKGENLLNADELHSLFMSYPKIKFVFAAHDHLFNFFKLESINYITTGGGGASLYSGYGGDYHHFTHVTINMNNNLINLKTIGLSNEIIESYNF